MPKDASSSPDGRRVSFAARFGGMDGPLKDEKGRPTRLKKALQAWGFSSKEAARSFRPSKASDRQVADRTAVQEDAPTSGQDTRKPRGGESDRPADHSDGMTAGRYRQREI